MKRPPDFPLDMPPDASSLRRGERQIELDARRAANILRFEYARRHGISPTGHPVRCSSCHKDRADVAVMIEMAGQLICDSCIELAAEIVAERKAADNGPASTQPREQPARRVYAREAKAEISDWRRCDGPAIQDRARL
jgi:ClpX C4-type zinc finger